MCQSIKYLVAVAALLVISSGTAMAEAAYLNYKSYCMQCHGMHGRGDGVNVPAMNVRPRDHTDAKYMEGRSKAEIIKVITYGGPAINKSVKMPAWGDTFTKEEIEQLAGHIRRLCCEKGIVRGVDYK